jgi:hypothetical protein
MAKKPSSARFKCVRKRATNSINRMGKENMDIYELLCAILAADVIVLVIGVIAAWFHIPYALEIISASLGVLALLVHASVQRLTLQKRKNRTVRRGGS